MYFFPSKKKKHCFVCNCRCPRYRHFELELDWRVAQNLFYFILFLIDGGNGGAAGLSTRRVGVELASDPIR